MTRAAQVLLFAGCVLAVATGLRASSAQVPAPAAVEARAVDYLAHEVPDWRREHPCYSCHNNGDAARALVAALGTARGRSPVVRTALDDTLAWLAAPSRWETNGGGEGGADDKRLARIQFAHATTAAFAARLVPKSAVDRAAAIVAADQRADGSWQLDSSDSIGSPATYGTALATVFARRTLIASGLPALQANITRADGWLAQFEPHNVPDAAAALFASASQDSGPTPGNVRAALQLLKKGQGRDGGWGPYVTSPSEPFDTAVVMLALHELMRRPAHVEPAFSTAAIADAIARAREYLVRTQRTDGSWNETTRPAGQTSYAQRISTTGWALLALIETAPKK